MTAAETTQHLRPGTPDQDVVERFEIERGRRVLRQRTIALVSLAGLLGVLVWALEVTGFTSTFAGYDALEKIGAFLARLNPNLKADTLLEDRGTEGSIAYWYHRWPVWRDAMIQTLNMAFVSTVLGVSLGFLAAILAARTTMPFFIVRWITRRILELIRTVPDLILAIILVTLFGLGPFAGVLTLTLSAMGALGRFFSDALENIEDAPRLAVRAAGGGYVQQIRYGVLPQVAPYLLSFSFLRLEVSVSSATTLGLVGAGGIGIELARALTFNQYQDYLAILIMIIVVIVVIDLASEFIRHRMAAAEAAL